MRRVARHILDAVTVAALLMCLVTVALWVRSQHYADSWKLPGVGGFFLQSHSGKLHLVRTLARGEILPTNSASSSTLGLSHEYGYVLAQSFHERRGTSAKWRGFVGGSITSMPYWAPLVLLATATAGLAWLRRRRPPRARVNGYCPRCRYDLTGNVSGVCPECGTPVAARDDAGAADKPDA